MSEWVEFETFLKTLKKDGPRQEYIMKICYMFYGIEFVKIGRFDSTDFGFLYTAPDGSRREIKIIDIDKLKGTPNER